MAKEIEVNGVVYEFPDEMSDADIKAALDREFSTQPAAEGGTVADALGQGVFFGFGDELAGAAGASVNSLMNLFGRGTGDSFGEAYRGIRDAARANESAFAERNPGVALGAEIGGGLLTGGVGAARAGAFQAAKNAPTFFGRVAPAIQTGAVQGGLFGAGVAEGDVQDTAIGALQGAALGATTAPVIPAVAQGIKGAAQRIFRTNTTDSFAKAVKLLKDKVGIKTLTTGQATGSESIRASESTLSQGLLGGSTARRLDKNRRDLQRKLMEMAGFDPDVQDFKDGLITQDAIEGAAKRFSRRYNELLGDSNLDMGTEEFVDALEAVQSTHSRLLPFEQKKQIGEIVDQVFDLVTEAPITAKRANQLRSGMGELERKSAANETFAQLYRELKHAFDDELARQLGTGTAKRQLDREYNRFVKIRDTFESLGGIRASRGEMPLTSLLRRAAKRGKGTDKDFRELVRAGNVVLGDPIPDSATASRAQNAATFLAGGAGAAGMIEPSTAAVFLGTPFVGSQLLSRGVTGSGAVNQLSTLGQLTAPIAVPVREFLEGQQ